MKIYQYTYNILKMTNYIELISGKLTILPRKFKIKRNIKLTLHYFFYRGTNNYFLNLKINKKEIYGGKD